MAKYRHSHIVPAGYLEAWTDKGLLNASWTDGSPSKLLAPSVVGVRSGFYREQLPDGTVSNRLDPAMSVLESTAIQIIRSVEDRWPIEDTDRGRLAEFVALQFTRTPAWREWYGRALQNSIRHLLTEDPERDREPLEEAATLMASDSERHQRILNILASLGTLFANMHWTLLRCGAPRLATSDHPMVAVPFGEAPSRIPSPIPVEGTFSTSEFRLALTPRLLLLMTWWDNFAPEPTLKMSHAHVRNHNAIVVAQAERQWFSHPAMACERGRGPWNPISLDLYGGRGYHPHSWRREVIRQAVADVDEEPEPRTGLRLIDWETTPMPRRPQSLNRVSRGRTESL